MIKIRKEGKQVNFVAECSVCGCDFTYNRSDVSDIDTKDSYLRCPCCFTKLDADFKINGNNKDELLFSYFEMHSVNPNMKSLHPFIENAKNAIPKINGNLYENSTAVITKISFIQCVDETIKVEKEVVYKDFGPKYEGR